MSLREGQTLFDTSVIVLAGGHSRRMGVDKALLSIHGQPLIARVISRLSVLSDDIIVSTNQTGRYVSALTGLPHHEVVDTLADAGPLSGLSAALVVARYPQAIVVGCDMPFVNADLLRWMVSQLAGYDAVVPQTGQAAGAGTRRAKSAGLHPLHAIYSAACLDAIHAILDTGERSMGSLLHRLNTRIVSLEDMHPIDPQWLSLRNINTPEDWAACLQMIED